jgi:hypothetical protein
MKTIDRMKRAKGNKTRGEGDVGELDDMISGLGRGMKKAMRDIDSNRELKETLILKELKEIKEALKK